MKHILIALIGIVFLNSCSAVFDKPITNKTITVYTPADSVRTKIYSQQFYWDPVDGASRYRLQVASPSLAQPVFFLDTIVTVHKINISLAPGEYEWQLRAENAGSETSYQKRKLFITQGKFADQQVIVSEPSADPFVTYSSSINFKWNSVYNTEFYVIQIDTFTGSFLKPLYSDTIKAKANQASVIDQVVLLKYRGSYKWQVLADSADVSISSTSKKIEIKMDTVSLTTPQANAPSVETIVQLKWNKSANMAANENIRYQVYLYDAQSLLQTGYPLEVTEPTLTISGLTAGKSYYWAVVATDAGNVMSSPTSKRKFSVKL